MRILRSQYLQQQNSPINLNKTETLDAHHVYKEQQVAHQTRSKNKGKNALAYRRQSVGTFSKITTTKTYSNNGNTKHNTSLAKNKSIIQRTKSICSDVVPQQRRTSYCSDISTHNTSSGYETEPNLEQAIQNDETICEEIEDSVEICQHMRFRISNVPDTIGKIEVTVEFKEMGPEFLTQVYKTYENDLWIKVPRIPPTNRSKWYFVCTFCQKQLSSFTTMKNHLNAHLELFPYACKFCTKQYNSRDSTTKHLKNTHRVRRNYGNYMMS